MQEKYYSEGVCLFCGQKYSQQNISRHLATHLAKMEKEEAAKPTKTYCHVGVRSHEMFLQLLVEGDTDMETIDYFLRNIWLECCGHMSGFRDKSFEIEMDEQAENVIIPGREIYHDYDYGTTTTVLMKGYKHYQLSPQEEIVLLSRNEPLEILCGSCNRAPATSICTVCWYDMNAFFCNSCAKKHARECSDFDDYANLPVVNSPRMGECGYAGGQIDLERDGVYRKS